MKVTRLRHPGRLVFVITALVVLGFAATPVVLLDRSGPNATAGFGSRAFVATLFAFVLWGFIWDIGIRPAILVMPWGLRVRNPLKTYDIPWADVREVEAPGDGSLTVTSTTLGVVSPFAFQASLVGVLTHGPTARRTLARITTARDQTPDHTFHAAHSARAYWKVSFVPALLAWLVYLTLAYLA